MHISVGYVLESEFTAACPQIPILIPITLQVTIDGAHQGEATNIKLSVFVEQWFFDIFLNYIASTIRITISNSDEVLNVLKITTYLDATSSI